MSMADQAEKLADELDTKLIRLTESHPIETYIEMLGVVSERLNTSLEASQQDIRARDGG